MTFNNIRDFSAQKKIKHETNKGLLVEYIVSDRLNFIQKGQQRNYKIP